jgi:hypothetical protein
MVACVSDSSGDLRCPSIALSGDLLILFEVQKILGISVAANRKAIWSFHDVHGPLRDGSGVDLVCLIQIL